MLPIKVHVELRGGYGQGCQSKLKADPSGHTATRRMQECCLRTLHRHVCWQVRQPRLERLNKKAGCVDTAAEVDMIIMKVDEGTLEGQ